MATQTDQFPNIFIAVLAQSLALGGSETEIFLSSIRTLDGQPMTSDDFKFLGRAILSVDVQSASRAEFISFTDVDISSNKVTGAVRGLSFKNNDIRPQNKKFHAVGAPVIIAFGTHNLIDLEKKIQEAIVTQVFVVGTGGGNSGTTPVSTLTYTLPVSGVNRGARVNISCQDHVTTPGDLTVSSVTVGGTPCVRAVTARDAANNILNEQWICVNPPVGVQPVVITLSGLSLIASVATSVINLNQIIPVGSVQPANGISGTPSLSITTTFNASAIVDCLATANVAVNPVPDPSQQLLAANLLGSRQISSSGKNADTIGAYPMSYTLGLSTPWVYTAIELNPVGATVLDHKVLVDSADTTPGFLMDKIAAGAGIILSILNIGGNEQLRITSTGGSGGGGLSKLQQTFLFSDFTPSGSDSVATFTASMPADAVPVGVIYEVNTAFDAAAAAFVTSDVSNIGAQIAVDVLGVQTAVHSGPNDTFDFTANPNPTVVINNNSLTQGSVTVTILYSTGAGQNQVFTTSGTWTKPQGISTVEVIVIGAGGGAGSGGSSDLLDATVGGGTAGGGGSVSTIILQASDVGATESVTVGVGGIGGASVGTTNDGNDGNDGSDSSFGTWVKAFGGKAGTGGSRQNPPGKSFDGGNGGGFDVLSGNAVAGLGAQGGNDGPGDNSEYGGAGGAGGGNTQAPGNGQDGGSSIYAGAGGGSGGDAQNGSVPLEQSGGDGGTGNSYTAGGGAAGGAAETNGTNGSANSVTKKGYGGDGAGGGGSSNVSGTPGGNGGNGGLPGGGGGGGGACSTNAGTSTSGAGGNGGNGLVIVRSF